MAASTDRVDRVDRADRADYVDHPPRAAADDDDSSVPRPVARPAERRQAVALLWRAARPDAPTLRAAVSWMLAAGLMEAIGPILGKHFIDDVLLPRHADAWLIAGLLAGMLTASWAASVARYTQLTRLAGLAMRSVRRLREQVYGHVLHLPMAYFDRAITGQLVSRITNDTEQVKSLYVQVLFEMLHGATVLIGAMIAMAWLDWRLMLIVLTFVPATALVVWGYQHLSASAVTRARELRSQINAQMSESIAGMSVLQATRAAARFAARFAATNEAHYRARLGEVRANAWLLRPMLDMLSIVLIVAVVSAFGMSAAGGVAIGVLYAFVGYIERVAEPLIQITMQFSQLQQAIIAAARVNTLLQQGEAPVTQRGRRIGNGSVSLRHVSFGYDPQQPVVHDLSLEIASGSFTGIVGHTGSGKSTVLALLLRFYAPQAGRIEIGGIALDQIGEAQYRADVAVVPQEPFLLAATARENIDMARALPHEVIEAAARAARAHDFILALERGYDTPLGEGGARLSSGQKQLLAVARALAGRPRILFLDEATARVDSETEQHVQAALAELHGQVTVIAIAHRLSTIRAADRIVVLNHGRLTEQGRHEQLMAIEGGVYQRLYLLQQIGD